MTHMIGCVYYVEGDNDNPIVWMGRRKGHGKEKLNIFVHSITLVVKPDIHWAIALRADKFLFLYGMGIRV